MDDMKVASIEYSDGFIDDEGQDSLDWHNIQEIASFSHLDACEFIVFIGTDIKDHEARLEFFKEAGMSSLFLKEVKEAQEAGFHYACFYA